MIDRVSSTSLFYEAAHALMPDVGCANLPLQKLVVLVGHVVNAHASETLTHNQDERRLRRIFGSILNAIWSFITYVTRYGRCMGKTSDAFDAFRGKYDAKPLDHALVRNKDELVLVKTADGRLSWTDGPGAPADKPEPPVIDQSHPNLQLWVVDAQNVPHALECGPFASGLQNGKLKHSNLTGGGAAHCGGELVLVSPDVVAINASSGRYGARSREELDDVTAAFRASGYGVWSYGWDAGTDRPLNFMLGSPEWVA